MPHSFLNIGYATVAAWRTRDKTIFLPLAYAEDYDTYPELTELIHTRSTYHSHRHPLSRRASL